MTERLDNNHPTAAPVTTPPDRSTTLKDRVRSLRLPENKTRPERSGSWLPWLLCLILAGTSAYLAYLAFGIPGSADSEKEKGSQATTSPTTSSPDRPAGKVSLVAGGYVIPVQRVQVSPKVGGEVLELFIEEGQKVAKGELLARLDRSKYEFEYRRTAAAAQQAWAEFEKLSNGNRVEEKKQAEFALREAEHLRDQLGDEVTRLRRSRTASSAEELFRIESRWSQAEAKVEQLRQSHLLMQKGWREEEIDKAWAAYLYAEAQSANAKYDLDNTEVRAPISGTILIKRAEVGNTVRPEAFSNGLSASLCEMADLTLLEVDVDISERDLNSVFVGQLCEIRTEAPSDTVYKGKLIRKMPEANRSKASVSARVRIEVPPNDRHLCPEMRARVNFLTKEKEPAPVK